MFDRITLDIDAKIYFWIILCFESIILLLLTRSVALSVIFSILTCGSFLLYLFPELGLGFALTGNVLLYVLFDYFKVDITAPVVIVHIILLSTVTLIFFARKLSYAKIATGKLFWIAVAISVLMIFGLIFSSNKTYGLSKVLFYFIFNIPVIAIAPLFKDNFSKIENLFLFAYLLGIVLALICFSISAASIFSKFMRVTVSQSVNPIFLSRSIGISCLCGIFFVVKSKNLLVKVVILLSLPILILPMTWSGSRAPLIGLILCILLFYALQPSKAIIKKMIFGTLGFLSGMYFVLHSASQISVRFATPVGQEASAMFRFVAWFKALQDFLGSPLLGIGTGSFKLDTPWLQFRYPHNLILELACENGIPGLILITIFIYLAIKYGLKNIGAYQNAGLTMEKQISIAVLIIYFFTLWNAMFSGDIYKNEIVWLSAGLISAIYISKKNNIHQEDDVNY